MTTAVDVVRASIDTWNDADRQGYLACYAEDCEIVTPTMSGRGHDAVAAFWASTMGAMPDGRVEVVALLGDGDVVVEEAMAHGTNTGPSAGPDGVEIPPTGQEIRFGFSAHHVVRDGTIARSRFYWDSMVILAQMGLLPAQSV